MSHVKTGLRDVKGDIVTCNSDKRVARFSIRLVGMSQEYESCHTYE